MLGRVDDPGPVAVEVNDEVLVFAAAFDRATDALGRMIAGGDADDFAGRIFGGLYLAVFVELKQVAVCCAGSHALA